MAKHNENGARSYETLAVCLGWFSIGLGLAEVFAPRRLSRLIGIKSDPNMVRLMGAREIATGLGILTQRSKAKWMHARVAGDALDLALLGNALLSPRTNPGRAAAATAAVAGVTAVDMLCGLQLERHARRAPQPIRFSRSITINRSPEELYARWRNFEDLPDIMSHLRGVFITGERTSHWVAKAPAGFKVEWDAEMTEDRPNEYIAWRSLPGAMVQNSGSVTFEPATGNRGTVLRVELEYLPPAGQLGVMVARLFGAAPKKQIAVDLARFKQKLETGEIARTEGQPAGRKRSTSRLYDDMLRH
jgi:uncharacterized membrane protein